MLQFHYYALLNPYRNISNNKQTHVVNFIYFPDRIIFSNMIIYIRREKKLLRISRKEKKRYHVQTITSFLA